MIPPLPICFLLIGFALAHNRNFRLQLTWEKGSPDGFERDMVFINRKYPGPLLEAQQGEWVDVEVVNNLPFNTTIHFHGPPFFPREIWLFR